ncbi:NAD(P)-binding protein [Basidiobolus meristosporus CBS 931.73]|uniref:NAD(P)-binding protein n=1 Tax=Basidiobolus meristosporus CBS 931.73 TaxID=1314790 RepID=A0A1Y1Y0X1_9FUNG|nr:NAD(P)-binding protein [Basidiobolus meristosporus CBS 931.73]|eukprot:ORX91545.1 NAD(P)-binding protein [Basidiobolus meristosporus CBS 931.73]
MGLFSFTNNFDVNSIPDLSNKVALVTGGNTGIGYSTCLELARKNAKVFMASRDEKKSLEACEKIKAETGNQNVEFIALDLADFKSVEKAANEFLAKGLPLHLLILNAGYMANPMAASSFTADGIEKHFAINVCGHFHLTRLLADKVVESAPARIVFLSSLAHLIILPGGIQYDRVSTGFTIGTAYGQSKLGSLLLAKAFAKRLEGKQVYVNAVHPGTVNTELFKDLTSLPYIGGFFSNLFYYTAQTPDTGALTTLYCATSPEIEENEFNGEYFVPYGIIATPSNVAQDPKEAEKLWEFVERLVDEKLDSN